MRRHPSYLRDGDDGVIVRSFWVVGGRWYAVVLLDGVIHSDEVLMRVFDPVNIETCDDETERGVRKSK
eukprot:scaffold90032_cov42-Cyclotella_meneghiniana.AAC.1